MSKIFYLMTAAMFMASCSQNELVEESSLNSNTLYANLPTEISTKVTIDGLKVNWSKNDTLTAFNATNRGVDYVFNEGTKNTFVAADPLKEPVYVIYRNYLQPKHANGMLRLQFPQKYLKVDKGNGVKEEMYSRNAPMWGLFDSKTKTVNLQYLTGMLKVECVGYDADGNDRLTVESLDKTPISGTFYIKDFSDSKMSLYQEQQKPKTKITVFGKPDQPFYVSLPPQTYGKLKVALVRPGTEAEKADGHNFIETEIAVLENKTVEAGKMYMIKRTKK